MDTDDLDDALRATLQDGRLSRSERQALSEVLQEASLDSPRLAQLRARAFALAKERSTDPRAREALDWVEDLVKLLWQQTTEAATPGARAYFSPGSSCLSAIVNQLERARRSADICVFTITDDRIARAILEAHSRRVALRIITDNDKQFDGGSDVARLRDAGIALRVDETEHHMHHKYAVLDGATLLNGSYNWTRSASEFNEENLIVTSEVGLVRTFSAHFDGLWRSLGG